MRIISYHASHEQFSPSELLHYVQLAEKAGFNGCHSSDHFHPWSARQGQSGFAFAWLGAAMQVTKFPFSMVNAPGQRYHPAIVAQALATLCEMFPERFDVALGSGEAINERINGAPWPDRSMRNRRLYECVEIIRKLFNGETVTRYGIVKVNHATLYTRPQVLPRLMCAAISEDTARWAGEWADGLLTVYRPVAELKKIIAAFNEGGGTGKPVHVQMCLSYARNEQDALEGAYDQWRANLLPGDDLQNLSRVDRFDEKAEAISIDEVREKIFITTDPQQCIERMQPILELGVENLIVHNINRGQIAFIEDFGEKVLPALAGVEVSAK